MSSEELLKILTVLAKFNLIIWLLFVYCYAIYLIGEYFDDYYGHGISTIVVVGVVMNSVVLALCIAATLDDRKRRNK